MSRVAVGYRRNALPRRGPFRDCPCRPWQNVRMRSRKTLIYLILTLNHIYPDYDFSLLRAHHFRKELGVKALEESVDSYLLEVSRVSASSTLLCPSSILAERGTISSCRCCLMYTPADHVCMCMAAACSWGRLLRSSSIVALCHSGLYGGVCTARECRAPADLVPGLPPGQPAENIGHGMAKRRYGRTRPVAAATRRSWTRCGRPWTRR